MQNEHREQSRAEENPDDLVQDVARARGSVLGVIFGALVWIVAMGFIACCRALI